MMMLPLAFAGSAGLGAGGSIWSGLIQRDAAKDASAAMADANYRAMTTLQSSQAQGLSYLAPFMQHGVNAGNTLDMLLVSPQERQRQQALQRASLQSEVDRLSQAGNWDDFPILTGKNASERRAALFTEQEANRKNQLSAAQAKLSAFEKQMAVDTQYGNEAQPIEASPFYEWQRDVGGKYMERKLAKSGLSKSGEGMKVLGDFVRGIGAEESERQYNRLFGMYNTGAGAAQNSANILGLFGPQMASTQMAKGQSDAQGILGAGEATSNMITGVTNALTGGIGGFMQADMFSSFLNKNSMKAPPARRFDPVMDSVDSSSR